jgi:hypothetical protein
MPRAVRLGSAQPGIHVNVERVHGAARLVHDQPGDDRCGLLALERTRPLGNYRRGGEILRGCVRGQNRQHDDECQRPDDRARPKQLHRGRVRQ